MCIWEWKRSIFATRNPGLEDQFKELSLPAVRARIQRWLDAQAEQFPDAGALDEYGFYINACFPISEDRRRFFAAKTQNARPSNGYRLLCCLAEAGMVDSVWSTNFDGLTARAAADFSLAPIEVGIDCQHRLVRASRRDELLCVSLHGDYRYDHLRNTSEELRQQEHALQQDLSKRAEAHPLVIAGYSGRDVSVMDALTTAYQRSGAGALYWCGYGDSPTAPVLSLIEATRAKGRAAYYVPTLGFDDLMRRLSLHCLVGETDERARTIAAQIVIRNDLPCADFATPHRSVGTVIRSNAFPLRYPVEVYTFAVSDLPERGAWEWLRDLARDHDLAVAPFKGKVLAIGTLTDIRSSFGERVQGAIERIPIGEQDLKIEEGAIVSLLKTSLTRSIAQTRNLKTDGDRLLWDPEPQQILTLKGIKYAIHEATIIFLRQIGLDAYAILKPTVRAVGPDGVEANEEISRDIKARILGWQHNAEFNKAVDRWRARLFPDRNSVFEFPIDAGSDFRFEVDRVPVYAAVAARKDERPIDLPSNVRPLVRQSGFRVGEPSLIFTNPRGGGHIKDGHQVRGIVNNQPFDFELTRTGLAPSVRLGVICLQSEAQLLSGRLKELHTRLPLGRWDKDYLMDFPSFQNAFNLPINIPSPNEAGWVAYAAPDPSMSTERQAIELARSVTRAIDALAASYAPNVVLIFVPTALNPITGFETEYERFDLHDFVKAYCVQKGVATQFLREYKLRHTDSCRLWWWLSLAFYVKSMRTPWVLDALDSDTAFVGLGYSIDRAAPKGQHIILGCSHIYNARGEGLQYRLTKIEEPIIRNKNCFLSKDDARRLGETIRQLFFESKDKLPSRVVIHKRTPFIGSERDGFREGLGGVSEIELIEVNIDEALRYVASSHKDGKLSQDAYPIRRGTVVQIAPREALLWVHGTTNVVRQDRNYYQGKRRIPAPLVIRRHAGTSDLRRLTSEVLGLSKMDWNTLDLYKQFPATLESSGRIARIGALLERHGNAYDYRLFI